VGKLAPDDIHGVAKVLGDPTRFQIFWHIFDGGEPVGIAELTDLLGLNHNGIRQHVAQLVDTGLLIEERERRDRPGRPRLVYTARDDALRSLGDVSRGFERLAKLLLEVTQSSSGPYDVGRRAAETEKGQILEDVDGFILLMRYLTREGFEPTRDGDDVVLGACPFADVAADGPGVVCELHRGLIDGYLGRGTTLVVSDPHEAGCKIQVGA